MKALTLFLLCITVGFSSGYLIRVPTLPRQAKIAPIGWVHIQKLMLPLVENVCEDSTNAMVVQLAKDFSLDAANGNYTKAGVVEYLRNLKTSKGFLPKGEIFTEYNKDHVDELKGLFELFYYARDFDAFYRAAAWARQNINCGLFIDALYLAILNRRDTEKISVPPPYELLPNYFINRDVVIKASFLLTGDDQTPSEDVRIEGNSYILDAKYTSELDDSDDEAKLAYFREDVGLNTFYFLRKLRNSPWFDTPSNTNDFYGEKMFQMMKQFSARYDLERYSLELPELEGFTWDSPIGSYDPMLIYSNGNEFVHRSFAGVLNENEDITFLKTIENNLASVVTHLRQAGHNKSQILNQLIELLVTSERNYETVARKLLGYDSNVNERQCSVLEHYMTKLRDPVFWQINKKIVQLIDNALKVLPTYTRNELYFPGVEVLSVDIKKMMTSFDSFEFDVTNSLKTTTTNTTFQVKVAQPRLNHKPFSIKLNISSLVTKKAFVKIYLGPKMMPGELASKKHLFVLLDMFELNLKRGANGVTRSSDQMTSFSDDFISLRDLKKKIEDAEFGLDALPLKTVESQIGYPSRLILPKGLPTGLPLQMFVFVAPFSKSTIGASSSMANVELNTAILSPGYPLDLAIGTKQLFGLPNAFVKDIVITHKSESKPNGGYGGRPSPSRPYDYSQTEFNVNKDNYDEVPQEIDMDMYNYDDSLLVHGLVGERPDFTYKKPNNNDYTAQNSQYRTKEDYANKRTDFRKKDYGNIGTDKQPEPLSQVAGLDVNKDVQTNLDTVSDKINSTVDKVHGLLGERPAFTYKNKDSSFTENKNQYRNKGDYAYKKVEYKKVDYQTVTDKIEKDKKDKEYKNNNVNNISDPKNSYNKIHSSKNSDQVVTDYEDSMTDDLLNNNKIAVHGLLGKSTDDYTAQKNKYEIKKDNYIKKAETKKIDYRKKAFEKKAKETGVLDYSLLEKPEDSTFTYQDRIVDSDEEKADNYKVLENKIIKNMNKTINKDVGVDKVIKDLNNKSIFKDIGSNTRTGSDADYKDVSINGNKKINKDIVKNKDIIKVPSSKDDDSIDSYLRNYDQVSKTIDKTINKNKDVNMKNKKHDSKSKEDSREVHFNVYDPNTHTTIDIDTDNSDSVENKHFSITVDESNDKTVYKDNKNKDISKMPYEKYGENLNPYAPAVTTERTKKRVSVYDFIFNPINYDDKDSRVYE
ncbi:arylphorin subunit alpha-like [Ostrinia furnacalis]|uniref:arylphorin subunit alpha-like n=1 Tax=Ostrinia furnacalis TaxID=93504 RepID=UPI0010388FD6|nr:arylphorin subunit alpha-like [Ostrinia furnacalis]